MTPTDALATATLLGALLTTAMVAGLLLCFTHLVMPGLGTLDDRAHVVAFQRIDAAVPNPWMGLTFLGSPVLVLAATVVHLATGDPAAPWLLVALVLVVTTIAVTAVVHLPVNAAVQAAAPALDDAAALAARLQQRWVPWNVVRTLTSVGSLAALAGALLLTGHPAG